MDNCLLKFEDVCLTYHSKTGETETLKNINLDICEGDFVSIVGPSGCGKTTMLSLCSGILKPTTGKIYMSGKPIDGINKNVGYMFQKDQLFEWRTIKENILLGIEIETALLPKKARKENFDKKSKYALNLLKKYGLEDFENNSPNQLSGGMRQRVALIRTLALNPSLLLLDEPFSALDFQNRLKLCDHVSEIIKTEKKTAILVTHDISEAISMSDKVVVLSKRPATVKNIHTINLQKYGLPFKRREAPEFSKEFDIIWKELQEDV